MIVIIHYNDPYSTTRIHWNVRDPFFFWIVAHLLVCGPVVLEFCHPLLTVESVNLATLGPGISIFIDVYIYIFALYIIFIYIILYMYIIFMLFAYASQYPY